MVRFILELLIGVAVAAIVTAAVMANGRLPLAADSSRSRRPCRLNGRDIVHTAQLLA